jgi:hypothetical protein
VSNLAADVNAAAEALDNLKSLLRRQFPDPDLAKVQRAPEPSLATSTSENQPSQFPPIMSAHRLPQLPAASLLPPDFAYHSATPL